MTVVYSRKRLRAQKPDTSPTSSSSSSRLPLDHQHSHSHSPPAKQPPPTKRRKLVQMHLDAGQSDISATLCHTCGMLYAAGAADEDSLHRRHHSAFLRKGNSVHFKHVPAMRVVDETETGKYIAVRTADYPSHIKAMRSVDDFVTAQLGGNHELFGNFGEGCIPAVDTGWVAIVFLVAGEAKGYVYAERVEKAQRARVALDGVAVVDGNVVEDAMCGIRKIWVKHDARRRGIAARLIELARANLIYGHVVPSHLIAFTATTISGGKLALSIARKSGRDTILMYRRQAVSP